MKDNKLITFASLSKKGERGINEDFYGTFELNDKLWCVLCDGLGGHGKGDEASRFVVEKMINSLASGKSVEDSIMISQKELLKKQKAENAGDSMKTTLTCLELTKSKARYAHVGDSRVYHFENNKLKQRTQDHSIPQMLVNQGVIKEKDIRHHEDRSRLLRVMGTYWETPKYQISDEIETGKKTTFLLCSDGFWELIDEKEMVALLKVSATPDEWLDKMEEIVLKNGLGSGMDNYTAVAVFIRES